MIFCLNVFYTFLFCYFILFAIFWSEFKYTKMFRGSRKLIQYLSLDHSWAVFSTPWKSNINLLLNVEYDDEEKELVELFNCEKMIFLDRKSNSFDKKYIECMIMNIKLRTIFADYIKNNFEKNRRKKIKKIEFLEESKEIKLWSYNVNPNPSILKLSSHNF